MNRAQRRGVNKGLGEPRGNPLEDIPGGVEPGRRVIEAFVGVMVDKLGYEVVLANVMDDPEGPMQYRLEGDEGQRVVVGIMDDETWSALNHSDAELAG